MTRRSSDPNQFDLFGGAPEAPEPAPPPVARPSAANRAGDPFPKTPRAGILAQIARDEETLTMDPVFWMPSREFYEERIRAYREEADSMMPD